MTCIAAILSFAVFTGTTGGGSHLYRLDLTTLQTTQLTNSPANEMEAAIAPDGRRVVFVSDRDGARSLYLTTAAPNAAVTRLTTDAGAYAHPSFAPDGRSVTARYTPSPEQPFRNTQLVNIAIADRSRTVLVDSGRAFPDASAGGRVVVVDHPAWFSPASLVFAAIEYSDPDAAPRLTGAGLWRLEIATGRLTHVTGGESAYDAQGRLRGFKATMPHREGAAIAFVGIHGSVSRVAMTVNPDGRAARVLPLSEPGFAGPWFTVGRQHLYVVEQANGVEQLVLKDLKGERRQVVTFAGNASEPAVNGSPDSR